MWRHPPGKFEEIEVSSKCYLFVQFISGKFAAAIRIPRLFKYTENFTTKKPGSFPIKIKILFYISAQNIDCRYSLEPPHRGGSITSTHNIYFWAEIRQNNLYLCKRQFYYIKVGFKVVKIIQAYSYFRDMRLAYFFHKKPKCISTIQYNTIQYNTIQYNTIQHNTIQYNTIQYNTIQYNILY